MRKELAGDLGVRKKFRALFERLGKKPGYRGYSAETILLKNIIDQETGLRMAEHLWFSFTTGFQKARLSPGMIIEFEARVSQYKKGYVNRSAGIDNTAFDYRLSHPTKIREFRT